MRWLVSICALLAILTACSSRQEQPAGETTCGKCQSADVKSPKASAGSAAEVTGTATGEAPVPPGPAEVWIVVDGMTKVQGITWMGWPNSVQQALEGLQGIKEIETDLASDTFRVAYLPELVSIDAMLGAIEGAGFTGKVVDEPAAPEAQPGLQVDLDALPERVREVFERAKAGGRLVIVDVHGPGWAPCAKMERVTYPSKVVQDAMAGQFERVVLDLEGDANAAALFKPEAIPVAVILDATGKELARKVGFVPHDDYAAWLKATKQH